MQRKPGFPVANCGIKMPDCLGIPESGAYEEDNEQQQRRQQLINFGHAQWGFNNWNWAVTKQELDFVELTNGKYCAGVVAFVSITLKTFDIHRENIGYATSNANSKGFAIYKSRKCAVTNALRETLLSFGGNVATELMELLETRCELPAPAPAPAPAPPALAPLPDPLPENNQNIANKNIEPKNVKNISRKESIESVNTAQNMRSSHPVKNAAANAPRSPPVARAHPMPCTLPPANRAAPLPPPPRAAAPHPRAPSNVSFVLQPVMGAVPQMYSPPRPVLPQPLFPNYYEYAGPWHIASYEPYERGNVNLNFNLPPKNLVVNSRSGSVECKARAEGEALQYAPPQPQGCWIKPTIFYDGFWTEQKDAKLDAMTEEEARAERKRRQRIAQEEFRLKQLVKNGTDDNQDLAKNSSSLDRLLMEIPTQDIVIQETGDSVQRPDKRRSPAPEGCAKRRASFSKLDIVQAD